MQVTWAYISNYFIYSAMVHHALLIPKIFLSASKKRV